MLMVQIPDTTTGCKTVGSLALQIVARLIEQAPSRVVQKERVLAAYEAGLLTADQTDSMMHDYGLRSA